jgi:hypothetical protein
VRIVPGNFHLEWLHDVEVEDPADEQILAYDATAGIWKNIDIPESAAVISSATPPANTTAIWFNTENGNTYIYYDDFWTSIAGSTGAPIISDTAPTDPVLGTQWFNSSNGKSYLYYSNTWVELDSNGVTAASTGNVIINGAFDIWQRGTSFTHTSNIYTADRFRISAETALPTLRTITQQSFTPNELNASGFGDARFYLRSTLTTIGSATAITLNNRVEDVRTLAGQSATLSFWAKSDTTRTQTVRIIQNFGSGGSTQVIFNTNTFNTTTSWQRFTFTFLVPDVSGKTIGDGSWMGPDWIQAFSAGSVFDIWGVQLESGPTATPFRRNAPSIQAELAACQRYTFLGGFGAGGRWNSTTAGEAFLAFPVTMRSAPSVSHFSNYGISVIGITNVNATNTTLASSSTIGAQVNVTASGATAGNALGVNGNGMLFSAEL